MGEASGAMGEASGAMSGAMGKTIGGAMGGASEAIVVVGDLVTDVVVVPDGEIETGTDTLATITVGGGGQGANTAAWLAHAGSAVTLVASVGDDPAGRERVAELGAMGVRAAVRVHAGATTGTVVVLASADERTLITHPGAALLLDPADVSAAITGVAEAVHLHLSGYPILNEGSRAGGLAALATARAQGLTTSVDAASAAPLRRVGAQTFQQWVRDADLLLCNADEAEVLAGPGSPAAQAEALTAVCRNVVVKLGGDGAVWCGRDGTRVTLPGVRVVMKDPTGAGDAFAAGLLRAWCSGAAPAEALAAGAELGARAVVQIGARPR